MNLTFENRVALVTGAGRGIGKAIAEGLAAEGATVVCVSRNENTCGAVAESIRSNNGNARSFAVDVADSEAVAAASKSLIGEFGKIDILVNNAGITRDGLLLRMSDDDWHSVLNTNLSSCFYWVKNLVRPMTRQRWGRIINISSVTGLTGNSGQANYAASKAGLIGLTKSLAREFSTRAITCNAVAPGFIETDMTSVLGDDVSQQILSAIPLKKFGKPVDISRMVTFLASEEANYITGQVFTVDGGMVM